MPRDFRKQHDVKSFQKQIRQANNASLSGLVLSYDDALEEVRNKLQEKLRSDLSIEKEIEQNTKRNEKESKDKEYLRTKKMRYRGLIEDIVNMDNIRVQGYQNSSQSFIDEMVSELVGYSVLEDAFNDPDVSDIFIITWDNIIVEKNGKNEPYHRTFRSAQHFKNVLDRFLREAGAEINMGDSKIVNFELFGDRGAATSPGVSPNGYSLTMRKHLEDHIKAEDLLRQKVMDDKLSNLLGMLIQGETNIICAGITGSGKTTTIRALLDHFVPQSNKRMIVYEDTQELFPENKHTLELVSVDSDDPQIAVSLRELIFAGLRLKPKYNVIGEVRGVEAEAAVESMETGHSTIFSMHGGTAWNIINRLVTKYLMAMPTLGTDVVERMIGSAVDYIFVQDDIPGIGRKITTLTEVGYDFDKKRVDLKTICQYDYEKGIWVWENKLGEEKIDKMIRRGIDIDTLNKWK